MLGRKKEAVAVVGAGVIGIAAALELAKSGRFDVTIYEKKEKIGGLSSFYRWQDLICDRFYHVILPGDSRTVDFIADLGLQPRLYWRHTKTGFFGKQNLVSLNSAYDFLRFPFLSVWQKIRLGTGLLYSVQIKNASRLDKLRAAEWLTRVFGRKVYSHIWEPLLRSKLGDAAGRTSAAFIWANISRLYGARKSAAKQERMGYVQGGYHTVWNEAAKKLHSLEVRVLKNSRVTGVAPDTAGVRVELSDGRAGLGHDKVLFTVDGDSILRLLGGRNQSSYWTNLGRVEYLGLICVLLVLKRQLSPYYVINLLDSGFPFTGVIESTNVLPPQDFANRHLLYLPKYLTRDDPLHAFSDEQIADSFIGNLGRIFPELTSDDILHRQIFREEYVQPVQELNYLDRSIGYRTPLENIYVANSSMIYDSTINNNAALNLARDAAAVLIKDAKTGDS